MPHLRAGARRLRRRQIHSPDRLLGQRGSLRRERAERLYQEEKARLEGEAEYIRKHIAGGQTDLAKGRLRRVLPELEVRGGALWAVYPSKHHLSPKVRAFGDFIDESLGVWRT